MSNKLGVLSKVDLREAWANESSVFTPWLAEEENLALLGSALGMELEYDSQERSVGPFRADILCKEVSNDRWVLIENQLEKTDHNHLGQILTYAAGLEAKSVVWIAEKFTEEHRAALDWLNEVTNEEIQFFGVEIELWKIGDSPNAPKFNLVSKPNDWVKSVSSSVKADISPTKQLQQEFWAAFKKYLDNINFKPRATKPLPQHWMNFASGRSGYSFSTLVNTRENCLAVTLNIVTDTPKEHFRQLYDLKAEIEVECKQELEWFELPEKKSSIIQIKIRDCDISDKSDWDRQIGLLKNALEVFHGSLSKRIKLLP